MGNMVLEVSICRRYQCTGQAFVTLMVSNKMLIRSQHLPRVWIPISLAKNARCHLYLANVQS